MKIVSAIGESLKKYFVVLVGVMHQSLVFIKHKMAITIQNMVKTKSNLKVKN